MEINIFNKNGVLPVRIMLTKTGKIQAVRGNQAVDLLPYKADTWLPFNISINAAAGKFTLAINGREVLKDAAFSEKTNTVQRLSFRTGKHRRLVPLRKKKVDLPNADIPVKEAAYYIDNVSITP